MRVKALLRNPWLIIAVLWCLVLASAAGAVYSRHRSRELFVELERLHRERDQLEITWGQLQLEQSAWSSPAFVERVATSRLKMSPPDPLHIQVVTP
jgi:cell division protein FtsL